MRKALALSAVTAVAFAIAPAIAQDARSVNYGVGPPSPWDSAVPDMSLKFGDAKRDAEIQRARTAPAQTTPNPEDFVPLDYVSADKLDGDMVDDASGAEIGRVTDVTVARDGAPTEIAVELNEGGKVQVAAASLRYNPGNRTLLTTADAGALKASTQAVAGADAKR